MKYLLLVAIFLFTDRDIRLFEYNGSSVKTIYEVDSKFYGEYSGRKTGFLKLNIDGSGEYRYDIFDFAPANCVKQTITLEWGFILNDNGKIVSFERDYGQSYPILLKSTGDTKFQGCQKEVLLDFIMEYKKGDLSVSSSDDWIKN